MGRSAESKRDGDGVGGCVINSVGRRGSPHASWTRAGVAGQVSRRWAAASASDGPSRQ